MRCKNCGKQLKECDSCYNNPKHTFHHVRRPRSEFEKTGRYCWEIRGYHYACSNPEPEGNSDKTLHKSFEGEKR